MSTHHPFRVLAFLSIALISGCTKVCLGQAFLCDDGYVEVSKSECAENAECTTRPRNECQGPVYCVPDPNPAPDAGDDGGDEGGDDAGDAAAE